MSITGTSVLQKPYVSEPQWLACLDRRMSSDSGPRSHPNSPLADPQPVPGQFCWLIPAFQFRAHDFQRPCMDLSQHGLAVLTPQLDRPVLMAFMHTADNSIVASATLPGRKTRVAVVLIQK